MAGIKCSDIQIVHQRYFYIVDQVSAIHLNSLRHVVGSTGHGAHENFEFHILPIILNLSKGVKM